MTHTSMGSERIFRQQIDAFAQDSIHNPVDIHRLADPQADCFITRLLKSIEQVAKAVDVGGAVHGGFSSLTSPSPWSRIQALMPVNPVCDVRHRGKS